MKNLKILFSFLLGVFLFTPAGAVPALFAGGVSAVASMIVPTPAGALNAISYSGQVTKIDEKYPEVMMELLYECSTIDRGLVRFIPNVKYNVPVRSLSVTVASQAYSSGAPSSSGTLSPADKLITPIKRMYYQEFDYEALRSSLWNDDMKPGAANIISDEFTGAAVSLIGPKQMLDIEADFWNAATSATATAVAALTPGTGQTSAGAAEQTYVAAAPTRTTDGIVTKLIYNTAAVGTRYKVAGTTLSATNIQTEINKTYVKISPKLLMAKNIKDVCIYLPYSCIAFINQYNSTATNYVKVFIESNGTYSYNGIQIEFVPIPDNCMIAGRKMDFIWATDLKDDGLSIKSGLIAENREDYFLKTIASLESWIFFQSEKVLYLG